MNYAINKEIKKVVYGVTAMVFLMEKEKKGEKGDTVKTQSNAEYAPSESIEEWPGGAKIHRLTSPKTYEEYRSQGKSIIENFFEERSKTLEDVKRVQKEFRKMFNVWR